MTTTASITSREDRRESSRLVASREGALMARSGWVACALACGLSLFLVAALGAQDVGPVPDPPASGAVGKTGAGGVGAYARVKRNAAQSHWVAIIRVPWAGRFLPREQGRSAVANAQDLDEAVRSRRPRGWSLPRRPTVVALWDPSDLAHAKAMARLDKSEDFRVAARFVNLVRIDVRQTKSAELLKLAGRKSRLFVYDHAGQRIGSLHSGRPEALLKLLAPTFPASFGFDYVPVMTRGGAILAREAWIEARIAALEGQLIDPKTGSMRPEVRTRLRALRSEVMALEQRFRTLVEPPRTSREG